MTLSDDLNFAEQAGEFNSDKPAYPVLFGVSFTPKIIGIIVGVVGVAGGLFLLLNMLMPAWDNFQQQQTKTTDLQGQINQKKASINKIPQVKAALEEAKQQKLHVLNLFANEKSLDTLLLDLNRLIESGNSQVFGNGVRAKLKKFVPDGKDAETIKDGSLGVQVNGKLKSRSITMEIVGTYEQTQAIMRNIERLQSLLIVKNYQSSLAPPEPTSSSEKLAIKRGAAAISTSFQLQALMALTPEELAETAKTASPKK